MSPAAPDWCSASPAKDGWGSTAQTDYFAFVTGTRDWARHEVTAQIPPDANNIIFGVFLNGAGKIELRNPQLEPAADG